MNSKPWNLKASRRQFVVGGAAAAVTVTASAANAMSALSTDITQVARDFFEACETGKGWEVCKAYCHDAATFSAQTDALKGIETVEGYTAWMAGLLTILEDGNYDLKSFATDTENNSVCAFAVFHGTHTGEGGPVPPTGKTAAADYVYYMQFDGDRISHITKIWNDAETMRQLGWA
jgi:steroid delta-isomerase-like uncharacterized protein